MLVKLLLSEVQSCQLTCKYLPQVCVLKDWDPAVDGFEVLGRVPRVIRTLRIKNLLSASIDDNFILTVGRSLKGIIVEQSSKVQSLTVPHNSTMENIMIQASQLSSMYFEENNALKFLTIVNSPLEQISRSVKNLTNLNVLNIRGTNLDVIDMSLFYPMKLLTELWLTSNKLHLASIPILPSNSSGIRHIKLQHNPLETIHFGLFLPFPMLQVFDVSCNMLTTVMGTFSNPLLKGLNLSSNNLTAVTFCEWEQLVKFDWLHVSRNRLKHVPSCLTTFPNVTMLNLSYNRISHVAMQDFVGLNNLIDLDLGGNKILSFQFGYEIILPKFKNLRLYNSCICTLNASDVNVERMPNLKVWFVVFEHYNCTVC
ncbi:asporin-like [Anopheles funestus]|uniref:asporin-like n=1 Tax=Anopheles funestus TaxID=62324 RepID=UPI0020C67524|nr:asporin-like [Anopheles funestus]